MYDLIIIGGGPAGITAAATALNHRLETLIIAERWGGQTTYSMHLEDVEGRGDVTGQTLLDSFRRQLDYLDFVRLFDTVTRIVPMDPNFIVDTAKGDRFEGRALIIATGARPQVLNVPGEARLAGRGLSYSTTIHSSLFLGKSVAVVGVAPCAQCMAVDLARKAYWIYLVAPAPLPQTPLADRLRQMDNLEILENAMPKEIQGDQFVNGIVVVNSDGKERNIPVQGVFVKRPRIPNSGLVKEWIECDKFGHILVDVHCATNLPGVFAAGDVTHVSEQMLVHIGEGAKAAESAYRYLLHC